MVYGKSSKGITPLRRPKLSKKSQDKQDKIQKKLYEANKWWNDWRFQINRNKLEWVDPNILIKGDKPYSVSSEKLY